MPKMSIAIPVYEFSGRGDELVNQILDDLTYQTFQDFDVIIGDHSSDGYDKISKVCESWSDKLDIKYFKNNIDRGNPASNFNFVMEKSSGKFIKFLCQDDGIYGTTALSETINVLEKTRANWLSSAYWHAQKSRDLLLNVHYPKMNEQIYVVNTLGTPSGITIKNLGDDLPRFDTNLSYCFDCDFYYRFYKLFGEPVILNIPTAINLIWENSITSGISNELISKESRYILNKYGIIN